MTRLAAITAAAALGALAFASPAAAQITPTPHAYDVYFRALEIGGDFETGSIYFEFGDDFEPGVHDITAQLSINGDGWELAGGETHDGTCEAGQPAPQSVDCTAEDAEDAILLFEFDYRLLDTTEPGFYEYELVIGIDGEILAPVGDTVEVQGERGNEQYPYRHGDVAFEGVEPGSLVEVVPEFLQEEAIADDMAAVVVTAYLPQYLPQGLAWPTGLYPNCTDPDGTVSCVVTDFEDLPGTVFAFTDPIRYAVADTAPGPVDVCGCTYGVRAIDAEQLEAEFGGVFWDEDADDLFGLQAVGEPESAFGDSTSGSIVITTTPNQYDLTLDDVSVSGDPGTQTILDIWVENDGPADAASFFEGGSYLLTGSLPTGLELVEVNDDESWICLDPADWGHYLPQLNAGQLEKLDFACLFTGVAYGDLKVLSLLVEISGSGSASNGRLELVAVDDDGYPGVADADPKNNTAKFSVNGGGFGQLPKTGTSLTMIIGVAALVVVAGVVPMVLTARKRMATTGK
jgi:hypothetical protein